MTEIQCMRSSKNISLKNPNILKFTEQVHSVFVCTTGMSETFQAGCVDHLNSPEKPSPTCIFNYTGHWLRFYPVNYNITLPEDFISRPYPCVSSINCFWGDSQNLTTAAASGDHHTTEGKPSWTIQGPIRYPCESQTTTRLPRPQMHIKECYKP